MAMRWRVVLMVALLARTAAAEGVTLDQAIAEGARRSPAVVEAARVQTATRAFADDHGSALPSVPQATVQVGARDPRGLPLGPEVVLTVQQEVSLRGLGRARRDAAAWAHRAATAEVDRARLEGASTAALEWVALAEAEALHALRVNAIADATKLARIADARATAGVVTGAERGLAQAEVGAAQLALLESEGRVFEARIGLATATGRAFDGGLTANASAAAAANAPESASALAHAASAVAPTTSGDAALAQASPAIVAAEARAHQADAEVAVLHAATGPTFSFGVMAWREGSGDKAATAVISVPLPFFDPARYDAAKQGTLAAAAAGRAARARIEYEQALRVAVHEREHTREVRAAVSDNLLVPLRTALATATMAYAAGTSDLAVVLLARRSLFAAEERAVAAVADVARADIKLATLTSTLVPR